MRFGCACLLAPFLIGCPHPGDAAEPDGAGREDSHPGHVGKPGESKPTAPREDGNPGQVGKPGESKPTAPREDGNPGQVGKPDESKPATTTRISSDQRV
jgi:hypothetical protein